MRVFFWGAIFSWVQKCREPVRALDRQIGRIGVKMTSNIKQRMGVRGGSFQLDPMVSNPYLQTVNKQSSPWEKKMTPFLVIYHPKWGGIFSMAIAMNMWLVDAGIHPLPKNNIFALENQ